MQNLKLARCIRYIIALCLLVVVMLHQSLTAVSLAQSPDCPSIDEAIPLASAISEQASGQTPRVFHTNQIAINLQADQRVILASTADGKGELKSDDLVSLFVAESAQSWQHDFRNARRTQILTLTPQDITALLVQGKNHITITLTDIAPPVFSTRGYYIVLIDQCPTATPSLTPTPTDTVTPSNTVTSTPSPVIVVETEVVTATPTPTALIVPAAEPPESDIPLLFLGLPIGLALGFFGTLIWWQFVRTKPAPTGEAVILYRGNWQAQVDLSQLGEPVINIGKGKTADIQLAHLPTEGIVARIVTTSSAIQGVHAPELRLELVEPSTGQVLENSALVSGRELIFGDYTIRYQSYEPVETDAGEQFNDLQTQEIF